MKVEISKDRYPNFVGFYLRHFFFFFAICLFYLYPDSTNQQEKDIFESNWGTLHMDWVILLDILVL
jgi:hypothetical protein